MSGDTLQSFYVEVLGPQHDREAFTCGVPALDRYLLQQAGQDQSRHLAAVYVLTDDGNTVAGFYTLSAASIQASDLPAGVAKRLPKLPLPVTLLGRMAVSLALHGRQLGRLLLADAVRKTLAGSLNIGSWALIVDAKEGARDFYLKFGFQPFEQRPERLYVPVARLEKAALFAEETFKSEQGG